MRARQRAAALRPCPPELVIQSLGLAGGRAAALEPFLSNADAERYRQGVEMLRRIDDPAGSDLRFDACGVQIELPALSAHWDGQRILRICADFILLTCWKLAMIFCFSGWRG
jgi:hypothetical protein